jgi:hypothetical protein
MLGAAALCALGAVGGWTVTDALESDNRFCVSCHLASGQPLHQRKLDEFARTDAVNLVSAHYAAEGGFRCIDCHGGASLANRLRVKTVAARDAALYVLGRFDEPEAMDHPLWDEDCVQCHGRFEPARADDYHAIADHNVVDFAYRCVECHRSHPSRGASPAFAFLDRDVVLPVCRNCHEEF